MKKILIATMITAIAAVSFAAPSQARNHHRGEALALGLAFGLGTALLIGSSHNSYASEPRECWIEKQRFYDSYGNVVIRKVRVCEQ